MLDKKTQAILDAFKRNTIEVNEIEENPIQINAENISPDLDNVGDLKQWTSS